MGFEEIMFWQKDINVRRTGFILEEEFLTSSRPLHELKEAEEQKNSQTKETKKKKKKSGKCHYLVMRILTLSQNPCAQTSFQSNPPLRLC